MSEIVKQHIKMPGVPLDALLDSIATQGEQYIADGNEHAAQVMCLTKKGAGYAVEVIAIAPMPGSQEGKDAVAHALGHLVEPFDAYIFLTEGYYVKLTSREAVDEIVGKVKDHPDRVEIFSLHFVSKAGASRMVTYEIKRDKAKPYLEKMDDKPADVSEGRFVNFYLWTHAEGEKGN